MACFDALVGLVPGTVGLIAVAPGDWETRDQSERCVRIYRVGIYGWVSNPGLGNQTPGWYRRATEAAKGYPQAWKQTRVDIITEAEAWAGSGI